MAPELGTSQAVYHPTYMDLKHPIGLDTREETNQLAKLGSNYTEHLHTLDRTCMNGMI